MLGALIIYKKHGYSTIKNNSIIAIDFNGRRFPWEKNWLATKESLSCP